MAGETQSACLTVDEVPGYRIVKVFGTVIGTSVRSRNDFGNWMGNLRANFGGEQRGYAALVSATRQEAINEMLKQADALGANAVIGLRFDSGQFDSGKNQSMEQVVAYGTAVVLQYAQ